MTMPLLATKLHTPLPTTDTVRRGRLNDRLQNGLHTRLMLLSAPAGFGKTTLLAEWLAGQAVPAAWISLDETDNSPAQFWAYFITALQKLQQGVGASALAAFHAPQPPPIESVLVSLINDLAQAGMPSALLVLDDYHAITNPEIHAGLDFFIEHLPASLRLVIATREDPPLALARLRARGQLAELRAADLRFSQQEAQDFLNAGMALDLPEAEVRALADRTEGWVAGLRLAAISLQSDPDHARFIRDFTASHRFLTDYLVDEVLSRQSSGQRQFLLRTSVLRRFNAALCDHVLQSTDGQAHLRRLEAANLFLSPLDHERRWYRYHHLFAQFLRMHLQEEYPDEVPGLYTRAMTWCAENDLLPEAIGYALEAKDFDRAAGWIEQIAPEAISRQGAGPLLRWIAAIPEEIIITRPMLCLMHAWALVFNGVMDRSIQRVEQALQAAAGQPDELRQVAQAHAFAHRAYLDFFSGKWADALVHAEAAMRTLPASDDVLLARTAALQANSLRYAGRLDEALEAHRVAGAASERTGNLYTYCFNAGSQGELYWELGDLYQAERQHRQTLAFAAQITGQVDNPFTGYTWCGLGAVLREWNRLDEAGEMIQKGLDLCREWRQADALVLGLMNQSFLFTDLGQYDRAREALAEARTIVEPFGSEWGVAMVRSFLARVDYYQGNLSAALHWADGSGLSAQDEPSFERGQDYIVLAQVLNAADRHAEALQILNGLKNKYIAENRRGRLVAIHAWRTRVLVDSGERAAALESLLAAMDLGRQGGYTRIFLDAGAPLAALLKDAPASEYRDHLLAAFGKSLEPVQPVPSPAPSQAANQEGLLEPLNERELDVLRLMAAGLSNREIGAELYLSENTIRWYASQIFSKMGVRGRGQAVALARQMNLLKR